MGQTLERRPTPVGRLEGKVALVTGAARGIGLAVARRFAQEGARLVLADIDFDDLTASCGAIPDAKVCALDVASWQQWSDLGADLKDTIGKLDILIANAGIAVPGRVTEMDTETYRRIVAVNQDSIFYGIRVAVPLMKAAGGGSIINMSSIDGMIGSAGLTAYCGTKFAVRGMTKAAAIELADENIRVNAVLPGIIDTPLLESAISNGHIDQIVARQPVKRAGRAEEVADMCLFLASDEASYCTGGDYLVDGGQLAGPVRG